MSSSSIPVAPSHPSVRLKLLPTLKRGEMWRYFGPAFVASVAYIDPGNFAANIEGGSRFGYALLWVLLWSNAMAILIQYLSAKLGIVTGLTLPQNCRKHFSRPMTLFLWVAADGDAVWCGAGDCCGGVPDSGAGPCGVPVVRAVHHGVCRNHRASLWVQ